MNQFRRIAFAMSAGAVVLTSLTAMADDKKAPKASPYEGMPTLTMNGTNKKVTFSVSPKALTEDIIIKAPQGFTVSPSVIPAGSSRQQVTVTYTLSGKNSEGALILKSGENKQYVHLVGNGTQLPAKSILASTENNAREKSNWSSEFNLGNNGYTYEVKIGSNEDGFDFEPFLVDAAGNGIKLYITDSDFGYQSAKYRREFKNPASNGKPGGTGKFYNNDGKSHIYRVAVTPDNWAFIYRDGLPIDTLNMAMLSPQPEFGATKGEMQENLLRNGDFEHGYIAEGDNNLVTRLDGWDIVISDKWNSQQFIEPAELTADIDNDNHVFKIEPYKWAGGWGDGSIEQLIDVTPGETYTFEALVRGGLSAKKGQNTGRMTIREVQDGGKKAEAEISSDQWELYSLDLTTSPECKQLAVSFSVGKGEWGGDITPVYVENARLVGVGSKYKPIYGFNNSNAPVEYIAFDNTGAYAPEAPAIELSIK